MLIRSATLQDAEVIACHAYWNDSDADMRAIFASWVEDVMQRDLYYGFLAVHQDKVVAGAGILLLEWGPSRGDLGRFRARIKNVWTHPDYRRQGLARELVTRCIHQARQLGIKHLSLGATELGRPLYEQLGFQTSTTEMILKL